jgi:hypothetical protein
LYIWRNIHSSAEVEIRNEIPLLALQRGEG